jgi:hypothetical protein
MTWIIAAAAFAAYALFGVRRHHRYETTGFDLGIFEQIVRSYAHGRVPVADLKGPGFNALGDHFHPILALLAPVYRLVPQPETLLVVQAALVAVSLVPLGRSAAAVLGRAGGAAVTVGYGLSWGLQELVGFDFHEVCFALPLLAMSLNRLRARRWAAAVVWAAPRVLVKEDLPLTVAAIGGYLWLRRQRWLGAATIAGGLLAGVLIMAVILPALSPGGAYAYADQLGGARHGLGAKLTTLVLLAAPTLFLALRSPLLVIALPTLAWRFLADNPAYWGTGFHYSAVLMPVVFAALLDTAGRYRPVWRRAVAAGCLVAGLLLAVDRPLWRMAGPAFWRGPAGVVAARRVLDRIPDGAVVAATNGLAPQLTSRCTVRLLAGTGPDGRTAGWVVADRSATGFGTPSELDGQLDRLRALGWWTVVDDGRLVLLRQPGAEPGGRGVGRGAVAGVTPARP